LDSLDNAGQGKQNYNQRGIGIVPAKMCIFSALLWLHLGSFGELNLESDDFGTNEGGDFLWVDNMFAVGDMNSNMAQNNEVGWK
jgi:hypothetical protein